VVERLVAMYRAGGLARLYGLAGATRPDHVIVGRVASGRVAVLPGTRPDRSQYSDRFDVHVSLPGPRPYPAHVPGEEKSVRVDVPKNRPCGAIEGKGKGGEKERKKGKGGGGEGGEEKRGDEEKGNEKEVASRATICSRWPSPSSSYPARVSRSQTINNPFWRLSRRPDPRSSRSWNQAFGTPPPRAARIKRNRAMGESVGLSLKKNLGGSGLTLSRS